MHVLRYGSGPHPRPIRSGTTLGLVLPSPPEATDRNCREWGGAGRGWPTANQRSQRTRKKLGSSRLSRLPLA
jgi:hypothetical protein